MGVLPNLSASFRKRYDADSSGALSDPDGFPGESPLMAILTPRQMHEVHNISPAAKLDRSGRAVEKYNYELPPMEITALLIQTYHIEGVAPRDQFPYAIKALGPVNAEQIRRGGKGLVSDKFVIVP